MIPQTIVEFLGKALGLLDAAFADVKLLEQLLARMGYTVTLSEDDLPAIANIVGIATELGTVISNLGALNNSSMAGDAAYEIVQASRTIYTSVEELAQLTQGDIDGLPEPLNDLSFWSDAATALIEQMLIETLQNAYPKVYSSLAVLGLIDAETIETGIITAIRTRFFWDRLGTLLQNPTSYLASLYGWGGDFKHEVVLVLLGSLLSRAGLQPIYGPIREHLAATFFAGDAPANVQELSLILFSGFLRLNNNAAARTRQGLLVMPVPRQPGGDVSGLYIGNLSEGSAAAHMPISETLSASITGTADGSGALGIVLQPGQSPSFSGTVPALEHEIALEYTPEEPSLLIGSPNGARLTLSGARIALVFEGALNDPEIALEIGTGAGSLDLVLFPSDGDSFVQDLLAAEALAVSLEAGVRLSSRDGFSLLGGSGLEVVLPLAITIGPVTISRAVIALEIEEDGTVAFSARADITAQIPPIVFTVSEVGLAINLLSDGGRDGEDVGGLRVGLDFATPRGIGLALDAGVVTGGGYLEYDPTTRTYAGVAQLEAMAFGLTAVGIISLQMPDGSAGWSLFISINASFAPIQLGFGFTLNGIGGLLGLNRSMDTQALSDGVRSGGLDSIMFPVDPIANAARIIDDMTAFFPPAAGQFVIGFMLQIGWGTPTLVKANIGFILQLPDPIRIALLGQVSAVLPTEELDLVRLNMDVLGVVDFTAGTLAIDASLRDSRVVGLSLSGDMALRANFSDDPTFLLSVGGFNPAFEAPESFPELERLSVALDTVDDVSIGISGYFALTSNTVQFGAAAWVSAKVLTYTVEGGVSFDVLVQFSPFMFRADIEFYISVKTERRTLGSVMLAATLKGPKPWNIDGTATLEVLGFDVSIDVQATIGSGSSNDEAITINVFEAVETALANPDAWQASMLAAPGDIVQMATEIDAVDRIRPDGMIEVRQSVAPLDTELDFYGNAIIQGDDQLAITSATLTINGVARPQDAETIEDYFARAQYIQMGRAEKLNAPSFEMMPCGVRFGGSGVSTGASIDSTFDYKEFVYDEEHGLAGEQQPMSGLKPLINQLKGSATFDALDRVQAAPTRSTNTTFGVVQPRYAVINELSGAVTHLAEGARYDTATTPAKSQSSLRVIRLFEADLIQE